MADTAHTVDCLRQAIAAKVAFAITPNSPSGAQKSYRQYLYARRNIVDGSSNSAAFNPLEQAAKIAALSPRDHTSIRLSSAFL